MSVADELTKLVALRDSGVLTEEEFQRQRAAILEPPAAWTALSQAAPGSRCGRCHKALSPAWRGRCNHCGAAYTEVPPEAATGPTSAYRQAQGMSGRKRLLVTAGVLVAIVLIGSAYNQNRLASPTRTSAPFAGWTPPSGFTLVRGEDTTAYRWLDDSQFACEIADRCWGMELVSRDGCDSSLYVELSIVDSAGTAVGFTNDTVGAVAPNQMAKMIFDNFETSGSKATLSDVSCY